MCWRLISFGTDFHGFRSSIRCSSDCCSPPAANSARRFAFRTSTTGCSSWSSCSSNKSIAARNSLVPTSPVATSSRSLLTSVRVSEFPEMIATAFPKRKLRKLEIRQIHTKVFLTRFNKSSVLLSWRFFSFTVISKSLSLSLWAFICSVRIWTCSCNASLSDCKRRTRSDELSWRCEMKITRISVKTIKNIFWTLWSNPFEC